jgi:hypothetical protein
MEKIAAADWGTRASVVLYRLEPMIDALRSGEVRYIAKYLTPVDQEKIKHEHGSGRYRLYLSYKAAGEREGKELDSTEFDILDPTFPPVIPYGQWVDDPKNKKWAWAKEAMEKKMIAEKQQAQAASQPQGMKPAEVLDLVNQITENVRKQYQPEQKPQNNQPTVVDIVETASKLAERMATAAPAPGPNIEELLKPMREDLRYYRERADKSQEKLLEAIAAKSNGPSGLDSIRELLKGVKEFLPDIKGLIAPALEEGVTARSRMSGEQEFWQGIITTGVDKLSPLVNNFAGFMMQRAMQAAAQKPTQPTAVARPMAPGLPQPQTATQPGAAAPVTGIPEVIPPVEQTATIPPEQIGMAQILSDALLNAIGTGKKGYEFAEFFAGLLGDMQYNQGTTARRRRRREPGVNYDARTNRVTFSNTNTIG